MLTYETPKKIISEFNHAIKYNKTENSSNSKSYKNYKIIDKETFNKIELRFTNFKELISSKYLIGFIPNAKTYIFKKGTNLIAVRYDLVNENLEIYDLINQFDKIEKSYLNKKACTIIIENSTLVYTPACYLDLSINCRIIFSKMLNIDIQVENKKKPKQNSLNPDYIKSLKVKKCYDRPIRLTKYNNEELFTGFHYLYLSKYKITVSDFLEEIKLYISSFFKQVYDNLTNIANYENAFK